ncbi:hypothetical protein [Streptomyces somaliensis]|uniref:hypothetical protein n=1 Tax=Streptomyces somaliensis TaxID=78355 RepID=UPI003556428C
MGTPARTYLPLVRALHRQGLTVVTTDLRGQGESVPAPARGVRFGYREIVEHDIGAVLDIAGAAYPTTPGCCSGTAWAGSWDWCTAGCSSRRASAASCSSPAVPPGTGRWGGTEGAGWCAVSSAPRGPRRSGTGPGTGSGSAGGRRRGSCGTGHARCAPAATPCPGRGRTTSGRCGR